MPIVPLVVLATGVFDLVIALALYLFIEKSGQSGAARLRPVMWILVATGSMTILFGAAMLLFRRMA